MINDHTYRRSWQGLRTTMIAAVSVGVFSGCGDVSAPLPSGITNPGTLSNADGARSIATNAVYAFIFDAINLNASGSCAGPGNDGFGTAQGACIRHGAFVNSVLLGGLLTDELQVAQLGGPFAAYTSGTVGGDYAIDARQLPEGVTVPGTVKYERTYTDLQRVRGLASQGIGALAKYAPKDSTLRGHLYALEGYVEVLLADLFCSGVPLSTLDYNGDYTLHRGSKTVDVYAHAAALFDTAIALSGDSARIQNLARVGKGRALLNIGQYAEAAQAVANVPAEFIYQFNVDWSDAGTGNASLLTGQWDFSVAGGYRFFGMQVSVIDGAEGLNGILHEASGDPRTDVVPLTTTSGLVLTNRFGIQLLGPAKYGTTLSTTPVIVASGVEAQLILAEAALHGVSVAGGSTSDILEHLREQTYPGVFTSIPSGLSTDALTDTLFAERAKWLFLTGQRQGDLRRLVREYHRDQSTVYPTGTYPALYLRYGTDVNVPIPTAERLNSLFHGCLSRGA